MLWLFKMLSMADFFTPSAGLVSVFTHDPIPPHRKTHTLFIPYNEALGAGWNAHDVEGLLRGQDIPYWGGQVSNGQFVVNIPANQAQEANYHLSRNGIPLDPISVPPSVGNPAPAAAPRTISRGYRTWTWIPCLQNQKSCKGKPTCSNCNQCEDHCNCLDGDQ